jgi:hypothetical protein
MELMLVNTPFRVAACTCNASDSKAAKNQNIIEKFYLSQAAAQSK